MPKSAKKSKPVKRATAAKVAKRKMMMTNKSSLSLRRMLGFTRNKIFWDGPGTPAGSKEAATLAKRMIACADALYKAAGVK